MAVQFYTGQNTEIPQCLAEKVEKKQKSDNVTFPYKALYKVEVKSKILYYLDIDYGKTKFIRMPTINYVDENCQIIYSSDDKDWLTFRNSIKIVEKLWGRELQKPTYVMGTFLNKKRTFKVNAFYSNLPQFPLKEKQKINISFKNGLEILENGKVKRSYKIIPKEKIQYNTDTRKSKPANGGICNAILFEHNEKYWLLYAEEGRNFLLISTDKTGQYGYENSRASLVLTE